MLFRTSAIAAAFALATALSTTPARADALADIMKSKVIKVAVPQDFAPFGSAGPDLKPQGYDIDMANLIAKELGVKAEIVAGHQRQPHPLPADQEGRPRHLQPRQESRAREGDRLLGRLCAVLLRRLRHQGDRGRQATTTSPARPSARPAARSRSRSCRRRRPPSHRGQALRGQQRHHRRVHLRPGRPDRHRQHGRGLDRREEHRHARRC